MPDDTDKLSGKLEKIPRMTPEDLKAFVIGLCDRRVFTSTQVQPMDFIPSVFMPIGLGALQGTPEEEINNIGIIWEWLDKAGPRSINGMPIFFSCRLMHKEDWDIARKAAVKEIARRDQIEI